MRSCRAAQFQSDPIRLDPISPSAAASLRAELNFRVQVPIQIQIPIPVRIETNLVSPTSDKCPVGQLEAARPRLRAPETALADRGPVRAPAATPSRGRRAPQPGPRSANESASKGGAPADVAKVSAATPPWRSARAGRPHRVQPATTLNSTATKAQLQFKLRFA